MLAKVQLFAQAHDLQVALRLQSFILIGLNLLDLILVLEQLHREIFKFLARAVLLRREVGKFAVMFPAQELFDFLQIVLLLHDFFAGQKTPGHEFSIDGEYGECASFLTHRKDLSGSREANELNDVAVRHRQQFDHVVVANEGEPIPTGIHLDFRVHSAHRVAQQQEVVQLVSDQR